MDLIIHNTTATWGEHTFPCTHGKNGFTEDKHEGDGKTPIGSFLFRRAFYRADRIEKPKTMLPIQEITKTCGWCDDPTSPHYNQYIEKPFGPSHEDLWLERNIYDLIIAIGQNDDPVVPYKGSAIFIHIATPEFGPTEGCIALEQSALLEIFAQATTDSRLITYDIAVA